MPILSDENRYRLLKLLAENPTLNQRQIASALDLSLGKVNYCLKFLADMGWIEAGAFRAQADRRGHAYLLTLKGLEEKTKVTLRHLAKKKQDYARLEAEIEQLQSEAQALLHKH